MLPQPLEVDVAHEGASLLGPVLIAIGGVIAAALTAGLTVVTANRRHRIQLEQDRILQEAQLQHDRQVRHQQLANDQETLRHQLKHDREMRHRENVQRFLDGAVEREWQFRYAVEGFVREVARAERWRSDLESEGMADGPEEVGAEIVKRQRKLLERLQQLVELHSERLDDSVLLSVRMGNHELPKLHQDSIEAIGKKLNTVGVGLSDEWTLRTTGQRRSEEEAEDRVGSAQVSFLRACKRWYDPQSAPEAAAGKSMATDPGPEPG